MEPVVVLVRPLPVRIAAAATMVLITGWAVLHRDLSDFGVIAYPAIIALQTAREWMWRLEVTRKVLHEKQGVGGARDIEWAKVEEVIMPNAAWWRLNPILKVDGAPNIQLTYTEGLDDVLRLAQSKGKPRVGSAESITLNRSLRLWIILIALSSVLFGSELAMLF
ncbi:hypothetical protein BH23ACT9_BH23ACT9_35020 [soil metagenome]